MIRVAQSVGRTGMVGAFVGALALSACVEDATEPSSPLIPPEPPANPQLLSTAWTMDVFRNEGRILITPPTSGESLNEADLQILADYFGIEPDGPDLSILAGDVIEIVPDPASLDISDVGEFVPGLVRTTFDVAVRNRLSGVNIITPTFPAPPEGTDGVVLFPFEIVVTETPGGVSVDPESDGTVVVIERENLGQVAPSVDWDVEPFNFFNDAACDETSNDCYRSETFNAGTGIPASQTSEGRTIGFDHDPTVSQFRVRMILAGDLEDAEPGENVPPIADADGPYTGVVGDTIPLDGSGSSDPDGEIVAFDWDLNDDGVFDEGNEFVCSEEGEFPVALQVTDDAGATATDATTVTCTAEGENQPPVADANGPYDGLVGAPITLDGSASSDPDGTIESYDWDFNNDGVFDDATGESPEFTCSEVGTFPVALQVTDDQGATGTASAEVNCTEEGENQPPVADANGPYEGLVGTPITLDGSASSDPDGTIESYDWDFNNDGVFDDATGESPAFTCSEEGSNPVALQVTDDAGATGTDDTTVECTEEPVGGTGVVRGRWVDEAGNEIAEATAGSTIFFEIDVEMLGDSNISSWQAVLLWDAPLLTATTQGADLNCSNPGGQATCPSGPPADGNTDVLNQYIGNNSTAGQLAWLNTTFSGTDGVGIQGLGRLQFTAGEAGTVEPELVIDVAFGDTDTTDIAPGLSVEIPSLIIN
ncbi:MAG: PKD domain-containing protein [Longimicrobiales bacterium]